MEAANVIRAAELTRRLEMLKQAMALIDEGATIVAMTLRTPDRLPRAAPSAPVVDESIEAAVGDDGHEEETRPPPEVDEPPPEDEPDSPGELTISTEGLEYPPQMLASIRQQEETMWQATYDELAQVGVVNVPRPVARVAATAATVTPRRRR